MVQKLPHRVCTLGETDILEKEKKGIGNGEHKTKAWEMGDRVRTGYQGNHAGMSKKQGLFSEVLPCTQSGKLVFSPRTSPLMLSVCQPSVKGHLCHLPSGSLASGILFLFFSCPQSSHPLSTSAGCWNGHSVSEAHYYDSYLIHNR